MGTSASEPRLGLRERNRARTYAEITDAALELFERQGFDATTVDQIASAAGVSPATFFRYFATKEDVLFTDEDASAAELVADVADRTDRRTSSVSALTEPIVAFAEKMPGPTSPHSRELTTLVMTTPSLAARSLRIRLRWERDVAVQLANEDGLATPTLRHTAVASAAVSCLASGLRHWPNSSPSTLAPLVREAFEHVIGRVD
ncbi:TetR family transcriptional regulator [Gordonia polyisoprenivorans]|uniref:TetR family transcriptional regulator n=1 Tax=Gordonia polyisoprenivorans TaxID=84595 RepID=UPI001AD6FE96|nr:TetR family transcriptional regulator [Gordonia polyisoprenivorans]QTI70950.1 TetR family transcriptional regulator [Gordonia polyisoprenivorans]